MLRYLSSLLLTLITCGATLTLLPGSAAAAAPSDEQGTFTEEELSFTSGEVTLNGTLLMPTGKGPFPAIALVHGAGRGPREKNLGVAEAFARSGVAALVYDKRTQGYTADGVGTRDYTLLADDALAAVAVLSEHDRVNSDQVGLWGLSEGAWVAPIAAARTTDVAFLVLAGASALPPAQQESWRHESALRHAGVEGSLLTAIPRNLMQLVVAARLMSEATYDPVPTLEKIRQPVLAVWGELERNGPPAESAELVQAALDKAGNPSYQLEFIAGANHELKVAQDDGFAGGREYVPAYLDLITTWVGKVAGGTPPPTSVGTAPAQAFRSWPAVTTPPALLSGGWLQLGIFLLLAAAFPIFLFVTLSSATTAPGAMSVPGYTVSVSAWAATIGMYVFLFAYLFGGPSSLGPVVLGRPVVWMAIQLLAAVAIAAAVVLVVGWIRTRPELATAELVRYQILLGSMLVFVPWATYWGLLRP